MEVKPPRRHLRRGNRRAFGCLWFRVEGVGFRGVWLIGFRVEGDRV